MNGMPFCKRWFRVPSILVVLSLASGSIGLVTGVAPSEAQDQPKEIVYGQTDFISSSAASTASTLHSPVAVAVDSSGNVYVADAFNNRVLEFPSTCQSAGCSATRVFGQSSFTSRDGGTTAATLRSLTGVGLDSSNNIYVADTENRRVLEFPSNCAPTGCSATRVFGQP